MAVSSVVQSCGCRGFFLFLNRSVHQEHCQEEQNAADAIKSGIENHDGFSITDGLGNGVDQNWQISSDVVHNEEEDADGCGTHGQGHDLHQYREHNAEPHLGKEICEGQ